MRTSAPRSTLLCRCVWVALAGHACSYPDLAVDVSSACNEYAAHTCDTLQRCGEAWLAPYGTNAGCRYQLHDSCQRNGLEPDVLSTVRGIHLCAVSMAQVSCTDLANGALPVACGPARGKRRDGAACRVGAQCAGGRCVGAGASGDWGECRELAQRDEACAGSADCAAGLVCARAGLCAALAAPGEACSERVPCRAPWQCVSGRCDPPGGGECAALNCSSATTSDAADACRAFGTALCTRLAACASAVVAQAYGDVATCSARNTAACLTRQASPDVVSSAAGLDACSSLLASVECGALLDNALPLACRFAPGARANGHACSDDAQCESTRCARSAGAACGTCSPLAAAGEACRAASDCMTGLVCTSELVCRVPSALDAACAERQPCAFPWTCSNARCSAALVAGAACDPVGDRCDRYAGLACGGLASSTCNRWLVASAGQACGNTPAGWAECGAAGRCRVAAGAAMGTCDSHAADGGACAEGTAGPTCLSPARCVGGVCRLPVAGECS